MQSFCKWCARTNSQSGSVWEFPPRVLCLCKHRCTEHCCFLYYSLGQPFMSYAHVIIDANKDWKETLVLVEFGKPTSQGQERHCQSLRSSTDLHSPTTLQFAVHLSKELSYKITWAGTCRKINLIRQKEVQEETKWLLTRKKRTWLKRKMLRKLW